MVWSDYILDLEQDMSAKAYIVTGLGFGDEGKGSIVHWLTHRYGAHTVIRTGGAQAMHRVVCADGRDHTFSQFGSGTPCGSSTHLSEHMVIDPYTLLCEARKLQYTYGFDPSSLLTMHENALVVTPFQAIAGRVRELLRGSKRYGSVGMGIGETILDAEAFPDSAIYARDLKESSVLREKLGVIERRKWAEFREHAAQATHPDEAQQAVLRELDELSHPETMDWAMRHYTEAGKRFAIVNDEYLYERVLKEGTVVFEGSQGVLLDRYCGFHPHTSKVCATPERAFDMLKKHSYGGRTKSIGVLRAYHTRHGAGPFVSESARMTRELPDVANGEHRWQGSFRVGHFDAVLARYALSCCHGSIDELALTCIDRAVSRDIWTVCTEYEHHGHAIRSLVAEDQPHNPSSISAQMQIGEKLMECRARTRGYQLATCSNDRARDTVLDQIRSELSARIGIVSCGPTEEDKLELGR